MAVLRILLLTAVGLVVAAGASANVGPQFRDNVGDAFGAPDITNVVVSSDYSSIMFAIHTTDAASWSGAAAILQIDTDANPSTGNAGGDQGDELSYVLHSEHTEFTLDRSNNVHVAHPLATWALTGPTLTIKVPFSELDAGGKIGFRVKTLSATGSDTAPDTSMPEWQFSPQATVTGIRTVFSPSSPRHAKRFALVRVTTSFSDGTQGVAPASCRATIGSKKLPGGCAWRIPANARGRTLVVRVQAAGLTRVSRFRVR